jgi:hypothetical protein
MRKANRKTNDLVYKRIGEVRLSEHERERVKYAMREAEAIVNAIFWVKDKVSSIGALVLKPGFKH